MQTAIISSPHLKESERKKFVRDLERELRKYDDSYNMDMEPEAGAFDKLRRILGVKKKKK